MSNCNVIITLSSDEYKAYADFVPAVGEGAELSLNYTKSIILEAGLIHGIDWEIITSTIDFCNKHKKPRNGVKIATGTLAISEVPEHWNLEDKFFKNAMGLDTEALKIDYKEQSNFIMVKKGELIAHKNEGRDGVEGKSVKGKPLQFKKKKIVQFTNGRNTTEHKGKLYASTSGRYEVSENRDIHINDVLHIEGNVDYSTGNISFGKDVIIDGEIKDGFKVAAGGTLYCKSNLDATDILCRKDLIVDQGIIGRGTALVRAGGKIKAKFIENCHVESQAGLEIEKNIMNSQIYSLGQLKLGEKGAIVSSKVYSELGVKTYNIGKDGSPNSEINLGFSFVDQRSIESIKQRVDVLKEKLNKLNRLPEYRKTDKKLDLIRQIQDVVTRGDSELSGKIKALYKYPDVTLEVTGTVFPGNIIIICGVTYSVTEEKRKVKFFLNKESNRVESVNL
ncbi:MAG: FapA family protein [Spirochaetaceae bacterium]